MCSEHWCDLGTSTRTAFWVENDKTARKFLAHNVPDAKGYADVHGDFLDALPHCDIAVAGFPCQPFAAQGLHKALVEERGQVIFSIIKYLAAVIPTISCSKTSRAS